VERQIDVEPRKSEDSAACVDIGIHAMAYSSSNHCVSQSEMEKARGPEAFGHFTDGFGQEAIACMQDHTSVGSLALSALSKLFHTTGISPENVGYLGVGTETNPDRSKSVKSILMTLFEETGNYNVEGVDHVSACYGAVDAMFGALAWLECSSWDGRYAVVVATDAALIEAPDDVFNGHGSFAVLLGPDAPIVLDPKRYSYHRNAAGTSINRWRTIGIPLSSSLLSALNATSPHWSIAGLDFASYTTLPP
jgi:hydroxymethylglutaryl-CoA synthase